MATRPGYSSIDDYIASAAVNAQPVLQQIRRAIQESVPGADETIAYQMPAFRRKKVFIYFAAFKQHIGIYPPLTANHALQVHLQPYRGPKGNLKFPLNESMPCELIGEIAKALSQQYA